MSNDATYLLAIAIGPVQDFIASSRKARDLWCGSDMLATLSRAAATSLAIQSELIFPTSAALKKNHAVANKLLVSTTGDPRALAVAARKAVHDDLRRMWREAEIAIDKLPSESVLKGLAEDQLDDFIEWYAAWVPYDPDVGSGPTCYKQARDRVERLLAGRKTLREFKPAHGLEGQRKSSLDASRESIVTAAGRSDPQTARRLRLKGAEELDGVSLVKRLNGQGRFVSTSRVAIDPFIRAAQSPSDESYDQLMQLADIASDLAETDLVERFRAGPKSGLAHFGAFPFDSQLFYEQTEASAIKQLDAWVGTDEYQGLKDSTKEFYKLVQGFRHNLKDGLGDLPAYFAVLRADGDKMGAAIGALETKDDHQHLSTRLGDFAARAREIVTEHFGAMIYSGGDDVLAFLPLDTALPCADALRLAFTGIVTDALKAHPSVKPPTLSVGVAIGHYAEHLQTLLKRAADAEKAAKGPRNALAVSFQAHSGGGDARTVVHSWDTDPVRTYWATAIEFHRHDTLPDGAAYQLDDLRRELASAGAADTFGEMPERALDHLAIAETMRILKRKEARGSSEAVRKEILDNLRTRLEEPPAGESVLGVLGSFVDEVIIARRLYRLLMDHRSAAFALWRGALAEVSKPDPALALASGPAHATEVPA